MTTKERDSFQEQLDEIRWIVAFLEIAIQDTIVLQCTGIEECMSTSEANIRMEAGVRLRTKLEASRAALYEASRMLQDQTSKFLY